MSANKEFAISRRQLLKLGGALATTALFPITEAQAQDHPEQSLQQTSEVVESQTLSVMDISKEAPVQIPESPKGPFQESLLFAFNARKPIKIQDEVGLEKYLQPFNTSKIGETTETDLAKILGPGVKFTKKGAYTIYEIPLPASTSQELARRYYDQVGQPPRVNEIITENGVVFAERVVGFAPGGYERVPNMDYIGLTGQMPESTFGHEYWGNSINNFYPEKGIVTITSQAPMGPDADMTNEYIIYDPRKPDGKYMTPEEFKAKYAEIHGKQEFDYNPNVATTP